jgi:hypothetical protein
MTKTKVWIELVKIENKEHAEEQCKLANNMLKRLGAKGQRFFYSERDSLYCLETSIDGLYTELVDNGSWFSLDYFGREGE